MESRKCPYCGGRLIKFGFLKKEKTQKHKCKKCGRISSDLDKRVFGRLRSSPKTIILVINLLCEGMGIRGAARIAGCHRDTVLRILKHAGTRSRKLLESKLTGLKVNHIEADEIHTTVKRKAHGKYDPETDNRSWGDFYIFLGMESTSKLLLPPVIGKRSLRHAQEFADTMARSIEGRFQITTDGFRPYKPAICNTLKGRVDFSQYYKEQIMLRAIRLGRSPRVRRSMPYAIRAGNPKKEFITTVHIERVNLSVRHFNKRFARKTLSFSKCGDFLTHSMHLFIAHYNFCKINKGIAGCKTPAMAQGIASYKWSIINLLDNNSK
jgi:transposase-like protein/IS1 family transposase